MGTRTGSSPRVRGKHRPGLPDRLPRGLIPACAGKTRSRLAWSGGWRAHPRVCGENTGSDGGVEYWGGSSPRVRGKLRSVFPSEAPFRLIPACAGKTRKPRNHTGYGAAHPRVCGENHGVPMTSSDSTGSSPRVRGKPRCGARVRVDHGLIPACAGKTPLWGPCTCRSRAHPRVCGENALNVRAGALLSGSSPRVRGKLWRRRASALSVRLIPACAGKTGGRARARSRARAHPRVCGENRWEAAVTMRDRGSSPRVRGKRLRTSDQDGLVRLIPACAGKTPRLVPGGIPIAAHPRVCGENAD